MIRIRRPRLNVTPYLNQLRESTAWLLPAQSLPLIESGRRWSDRLLVIAAVLMAWALGDSLGQRFAAARDAVVKMYPSRRRPGGTFAGFAKALLKRTATLLPALVEHLRKRMTALCEESDCWRIGPWCPFAADSSKWDVPRTAANEQALGCGGRDKSGPQVLLGALVHLCCGLPWSWRLGRAIDSERQLLRCMLEDLPKRSLLVADAGFVGFELLQSILSCGVQFVIRAGANVRLIEQLGLVIHECGEGIVHLWPQDAQQRKMMPLMLRRVVVVDGRNRRMVLLTSVLDCKQLSDEQVVRLYRLRWGIELLYRTIKQTMGRAKLLSDTPAAAMTEGDWTMMGLWMVGLFMLGAKDSSATVSIAGTAQALEAVRNAMSGRIQPGKRTLKSVLKSALRDDYQRHRPKAARNWPHKKKEKPPGEPLARTAQAPEIELLQELIRTRPAA